MVLKNYSVKQLDIAAIIVSVLVVGLVVVMHEVRIPIDVDFSFLPPFHAVLNSIAALMLIAALYFVKQKNIKAHKKMMTAALITSGLFLLSYVVYHFTTEATKYCQEGNIRYVYFFFLITHVVLAAVSFPFILMTFIRGFKMEVERHKKMTRWVFPIWLYVAITGPICYLMLMPCY